jgi:predicted dehydrogenase
MTDNVQAIIYQSGAALKPAGNPKADRRRYFMLGHGSHLVDLIRFLGGEIVSVRAQLVEKFGAYCWLAAVEFASGAVGQIDLTIAVRGDFEGGFRIYGENGSVNARSHLPWFHKAADVECFSTRDGRFHRPLGEDAYTYKLQIEGFADTILHRAPQLGANADDGVASVRMMVALARSAETGATVRLDEVTGAV